ncbi:hypothetical protein, partial [Klebsiella pneumoniae]|uniref:hypothetical protein n=1 Tax=Klebsiella pneumoniae TaxID=573 RepID=UPI001EEDAF87
SHRALSEHKTLSISWSHYQNPECSYLAPAKKLITGVKTDILNYEEFMPQNQDTFSTQKSNPLQSGKVN